jgi:hypothetical protein
VQIFLAALFPDSSAEQGYREEIQYSRKSRGWSIIEKGFEICTGL